MATSTKDATNAVIKTGGKQYLVHEGDEVLVEKLTEEKTVSFKSLTDGKTVKASVVGPEKGPKLIVFKFRPKKKYRKKTGHRQGLTRIKIDKISA
ncbi:50S ribosomal protein L21 [Patescibacteria group bacterium]|nr:50S ribosomal protein L21 [Patescibacteria group bacterium]